MLNDFLALGGNEVLNSARAYGYATTAECAVDWLADPECDSIATAEGDSAYTYETISEAPWYDPDDPDTTARFLGLYGIEMRGLSDSTRTASVTEKTTDGGVVSGYRHASREVRVRGWLTARGEDALEAGMTWLRNVLEPNACGQHGTACGDTDAAFFVNCPPVRDVEESDLEYAERVNETRRFLHSVRCISGPFILQEAESSDGIHYGRLVEFTLLAGVPWVYGMPKDIEVPPLVPIIVQDIAYNLAPYPSAEITDSTVFVSTNYSTNPSLETNATGWTGAVAGAGLSATSGRVTGELAAVGTASYRVVATAAAAGSGGTIRAEQEVAIPDATVKRYSISMWAAAVVITGSPVLGSIQFRAYWRSGSGGATLRTDDLGSVPAAGGAVSVKSIAPPAGATHVLVRAELALTSWANGNVVRLYADALAVTNP